MRTTLQVKVILFSVVAVLLSGCTERAFYVDSVRPEDNAENVSRSAPIVITLISEGILSKDQISNDYFYLEDLGKENAPTPSGTPTTDSASPAKDSEPKDKSATETEKKKSSADTTSSSAGERLNVVVYVMQSEYGIGKDKKQLKTTIVLAPTRLLKAREYYRVMVNHELQDAKNNQLLTDHTVTFKTGSFPEETDSKLVSLEPKQLTPAEAVKAEPAPVAQPAAPTKTEEPDPTDEEREDEEEANEGESEPAATPTAVAPTKTATSLDSQGTFYVHPDQNFLLTFSGPTNFESIKKWLHLKKEKEEDAVVYQNAELTYRILLLDDISKPDERLRRFIIEPEVLLTGSFILSFVQPGKSKIQINLIGDNAKGSLVHFKKSDSEKKLGLDDFRLVEDDDEE